MIVLLLPWWSRGDDYFPILLDRPDGALNRWVLGRGPGAEAAPGFIRPPLCGYELTPVLSAGAAALRLRIDLLYSDAALFDHLTAATN